CIMDAAAAIAQRRSAQAVSMTSGRRIACRRRMPCARLTQRGRIMTTLVRYRAWTVALIALGISIGTHAAEFPTKPVRLIVPFAPGGSNDIMARIAAQKFTESLGQQVIVDNRPGASGIVGTKLATDA